MAVEKFWPTRLCRIISFSHLGGFSSVSSLFQSHASASKSDLSVALDKAILPSHVFLSQSDVDLLACWQNSQRFLLRNYVLILKLLYVIFNISEVEIFFKKDTRNASSQHCNSESYKQTFGGHLLIKLLAHKKNPSLVRLILTLLWHILSSQRDKTQKHCPQDKN